ncbi:MAG TPA: hypothetical protein VN799_06595 [Acidimicrobiales bacterium]|nr:hypothetical protein [Acidimicrobiales bacterium]
MESDPSPWYSVRCVFRSDSEDGHLYEERITLWRAENLDEAIALAEEDATGYAERVDVEYLGLAQAYWLPSPPDAGAEVFSLLRESGLDPDDYLDHFFDTGRERQADED